MSPQEKTLLVQAIERLSDEERAVLRHETIRLPTPLRVLASIVVLLLICIGAALRFVPWVQTAAGAGQVVALSPTDRVQDINVFVDGRIKHWFVQDGDTVKKGDEIVEIADLDPMLLPRLEAERAAIARGVDAARSATETGKLNYDRQRGLFEEGLSSRKDFEIAKIRYQELLAKEAEALAGLNKADIALSRQSSQIVTAPQDGRIVQITAGDQATLLKAGDRIAIFAPHQIRRAVEVYLRGIDAPLVHAGDSVRLIFEGWPAVQFSGWPQTAIGTFAGRVISVDPTVSANGKFRALIGETAPGDWPPPNYLRLGAKVRAWVQLEEVALGYEMWRQLNQFPPEAGQANSELKGRP